MRDGRGAIQLLGGQGHDPHRLARPHRHIESPLKIVVTEKTRVTQGQSVAVHGDVAQGQQARRIHRIVSHQVGVRRVKDVISASVINDCRGCIGSKIAKQHHGHRDRLVGWVFQDFKETRKLAVNWNEDFAMHIQITHHTLGQKNRPPTILQHIGREWTGVIGATDTKCIHSVIRITTVGAALRKMPAVKDLPIRGPDVPAEIPGVTQVGAGRAGDCNDDVDVITECFAVVEVLILVHRVPRDVLNVRTDSNDVLTRRGDRREAHRKLGARSAHRDIDPVHNHRVVQSVEHAHVATIKGGRVHRFAKTQVERAKPGGRIYRGKIIRGVAHNKRSAVDHRVTRFEIGALTQRIAFGVGEHIVCGARHTQFILAGQQRQLSGRHVHAHQEMPVIGRTFQGDEGLAVRVTFFTGEQPVRTGVGQRVNIHINRARRVQPIVHRQFKTKETIVQEARAARLDETEPAGIQRVHTDLGNHRPGGVSDKHHVVKQARSDGAGLALEHLPPDQGAFTQRQTVQGRKFVQVKRLLGRRRTGTGEQIG